MVNLLENYGIYTFNDNVMKERVSDATYKEFHRALDQGESLSKEVASIIAEAMKNWAIKKEQLTLLTGFPR